MKEWINKNLGSISIQIQTGPFGSQLHQSDYSDIGTPVIMPKDIVDGKISDDSIARVEEAHVNRLARHKVNEGDIIYPRRGDVRKCAYTVAEQSGWLCGTGCLRVTIDNKKAVPKYVFYHLQEEKTRGWIEKHAIGATMLNLNTSILSNIPLRIPRLDVQKKIATILSRYDSLIDNYQKQIKLLEEAAQRLYKEWFVNLRFPGHESTKIVDGVPEGWEKKRLSDIGNIITGKTPSTSHKEYYGGTIPFITIPDMHGLFPENSQYLTDVGANMQAKKFIPKGSIIVSCIGTAGLVCIAKEICQTNQQINSLILNDIELLGYMYFTLCGLKGHLNNIGSNGATMTNVSKSKFESIETMIPTTRLYKEFNDICSTIFNTIKSLSTQLRLLTESRDRLLPKLLSGEIEV